MRTIQWSVVRITLMTSVVRHDKRSHWSSSTLSVSRVIGCSEAINWHLCVNWQQIIITSIIIKIISNSLPFVSLLCEHIEKELPWSTILTRSTRVTPSLSVQNNLRIHWINYRDRELNPYSALYSVVLKLTHENDTVRSQFKCCH